MDAAMMFAKTLRVFACRPPVLLALGLLCVMVRSAAAAVVHEHTWDNHPHAWTSMYNDVSLGWDTTGGNPNGWMPIVFPPTTEPEIGVVEWEEIIYTDANDFFAGNWTPGMCVGFDFWASNALPQNVQLQFGSTNGNVWSYDVTSLITQTQSWQTIEVSLAFSDAWGPLPGFDDDEEQFLADLAAIDWIGIYIFREDAGVEIYGLDNFRLLVPEPGQLALLSSVLLGAFFNRRRRRLDFPQKGAESAK